MTSEQEGRHERLDQEPDDEPLLGDAPPQTRTLFSNSVYDKLKWTAQILLPALATFYMATGSLLELPKTEEVVGILVAFDLFLGALLGVSSKQYDASEARFDGDIVVNETDDKITYRIEPHVDPQLSFKPGKDVTFKVRPEA